MSRTSNPEKEDIIVLGGGLVGQYAAYKLGSRLITLKPEKTIPYVFLHDAQENRALLDDLGIHYGTGIWKIAFMFRGQFFKEADQDMVNEYHTKCYGHPPNKPQFKKPYYETLKPNYYEVRAKLEEKTKDLVTYGKVVFVDLLSHVVTFELPDHTHGSISYKKLINTLPLPDLLRMAGVVEASSYESRPIFYYKMPEWPKGWESDYDTVHIMDEADMRTRMVKGTAEPNTYFLETLEQNEKYGELSQVVKYGKIFNRGWHLAMRDNALRKLQEQDVFCLGRFARFQQHYDTQHALADLEAYLRLQLERPPTLRERLHL